ncbi:hypothetical protein CLU79DRAFT_849403 [Phycomyces nitens]|nr:hypothetical protein CLU79DRAFT_849403 [Phycomyces nitens]
MHFLPAVSRFCRDVLSSSSSSVQSFFHSPFAASFTSLPPISTSSYDGDDEGESVGHSVGTTEHLPEVPTQVPQETLLRVNAWLDSWRESDLYKRYEQERQYKEESNTVRSSERLCSRLAGDDSGSVLGAGQSPNLASEAQQESLFELDAARCVGEPFELCLEGQMGSELYHESSEELIDADCVGDCSSAALDFSLGSDSYLVHPNGWNNAQLVEDLFDRMSEGILSYDPEEVHSQEWNPTCFTGEDNDLTPNVESGDHQYSSPQHQEGNLSQQRMPSDSSVIRSEPAFNPFAVEAMDTEEDGIPLWALTHLRGETIRPQVSPRSLTHSEHVWLHEACDAWGAGRFGQPPWQGFVTSARDAEGIAHHSILEEYLETVSNYGGGEFFQSVGITHYIPYAEMDVEWPVQEESMEFLWKYGQRIWVREPGMKSVHCDEQDYNWSTILQDHKESNGTRLEPQASDQWIANIGHPSGPSSTNGTRFKFQFSKLSDIFTACQMSSIYHEHCAKRLSIPITRMHNQDKFPYPGLCTTRGHHLEDARPWSTKSGHPSAADCPAQCGGHIVQVAHGFCWRLSLSPAGSLIVSAADAFVPVGSPAVPVGAFVPAGGSVGIGIGIGIDMFCPASRV